MIEIKSKVGEWNIVWKSAPRGSEGTALVLVQSQQIEVRWKRDLEGLWIALPQGVFGFDFKRETDELGQTLFEVSQRGNHHEWVNVPFFRGEQGGVGMTRSKLNQITKIKAQMPGRIVRVLVKAGDRVEKGQPAVVMEAMKMENEIKVPQAGQVLEVKVSEGQVIETGAELLGVQKITE